MSGKDFSLLLPNITIWNLEHKLKVCHSQNTAVAYRYGIIGISHTCFAVSSGEIPWLFHDLFEFPWLFSPIFHNFSMISMTRFFHDCGNPLLSSTEVTLFIDCNNYLQSETLLKPRDDVACDVMSRLSDPHLMKLATYALLPVKCLQCPALITACIIRPTNCFLLQLFVSPFLSHRFPDVASLVDFLYCLVCLREILLDKKFETWPKFRVVTAPGLKFRVVSRPPWPRLAARLVSSHSDRICIEMCSQTIDGVDSWKLNNRYTSTNGKTMVSENNGTSVAFTRHWARLSYEELFQ